MLPTTRSEWVQLADSAEIGTAGTAGTAVPIKYPHESNKVTSRGVVSPVSHVSQVEVPGDETGYLPEEDRDYAN
jgi:hypothetical protein